MKSRLCIPASLDSLSELMDGVCAFCNEHGLSGEVAMEVQLVLEELVVNVIHHGIQEKEQSSIDICLEVMDHTLIMEIVDEGHPFDPLSHRSHDLDTPFEERPIGGMGIVLVKELTDSVSYCRRNGKNIVRLTKTLVKGP